MVRAAWIVVCALTFAALFGQLLAPYRYDKMSRDQPDAEPSKIHLMGTDVMGRDRWSRLLVGTQVSLLLAPLAALLSTLLAAAAGGLAGLKGGLLERLIKAVCDLFLCLPWMFLLIAVRALLPLNSGPETSVLATFLLLGLLGWAGPARVVRARTQSLLQRGDHLWRRASGITASRMLWLHIVPNLRPVLIAQFWVSAPLFVLSEANLSIIGLGVSEPLPSWGSLLRELEGNRSLSGSPWLLAPLALPASLVASAQLLARQNRRSSG